MAHPYREALGASPPPADEPANERLDDVALSVALLVIGALGVAIGVVAGRPLELSIGLLMMGLGARVTQ